MTNFFYLGLFALITSLVMSLPVANSTETGLDSAQSSLLLRDDLPGLGPLKDMTPDICPQAPGPTTVYIAPTKAAPTQVIAGVSC